MGRYHAHYTPHPFFTQYSSCNNHLPCVSYLSRPSVAFLGESNVANTFVIRVCLEVAAVGDVVEVLDILNSATRVPGMTEWFARVVVW